MGDKLDLRTESIGHGGFGSWAVNSKRKNNLCQYDMKIAMLVVSAAVFACQFSLAQTTDEKDVLQFERDACKAFLDGDVAALERVLTPDFTLTLSNGEVSTRADEINELRSGKVHYDVFENYDMLARLYGNDTAVVLGKTRVKGTADGKPFDRIVQFTDTVIKRNGRWQLAAGHVSRIEK
jgi:ketosteroid isomerase-like protein